MTLHLVQVNIGRLQYDNDDPRVADFFANLDRINALAERMPGFVWRLKDASNNATSIAWPGDPATIVNMSVWESIEALEAFVWQTAHAKVYARKHEWFEAKGTAPYFAMWWIEPGHIPTVIEAKERLDHLARNGSCEFAFGWEAAPQATLWRAKRCA